jgi:hypothetical protein
MNVYYTPAKKINDKYMLFIFFVKNATEKGNILEKAKIPQEALA